MKPLVLALLMATTSGCAGSLSFAPPAVDHSVVDKAATQAGALTLLSRYETAYRSALSKNANGRQIFEVPAIVAVIGGIAATAFGGGRDGALVAATSSATFRSGNSYYAPKAKAAMYVDAVNALHCTRRITNGISAGKIIGMISSPIGSMPAGEEIIYDEVVAGITEISTALTNRLSNAGSVSDVAGIAAEFENSIKKEAEARQTSGNAKNVRLLAKLASLSVEEATALRVEFQEQVHRCAVQAKGTQ